MIQENTELNNIADSIQISNQDAIDLLYSHRNDKISVIDLDPYGSIANFLDGGV